MGLFLRGQINYLIILSLFFFLSSSKTYAQELDITAFSLDTSGYINYSEEGENSSDVVPTINGELTVNEQGALTYTIPIEVYKGIRDFQPNIALVYNSQTGNGLAGVGWGIAGLSTITIGGKNKKIDGINEGIQYDGTDPYYLDGLRLIQIGSSDEYVTEQYSQIKITKTDTNTFKIQYSDGKIAIYKYKVVGQFLIDTIQDSFGNKIFYSYTISSNANVVYLSTIKYGGPTKNLSPFTILFEYDHRTYPRKIFRNGIEITNNKYLKEIKVSSTTLGVHRRYLLEYDSTSTKMERLRKIEVENGSGEKLKPLLFNYNSENETITVSRSTTNATPFKTNTKYLGDITYGDFIGNGEISAVYFVSTEKILDENNPTVDQEYTLISSKYGYLETSSDIGFNEYKLLNGRIIETDGKYSPTDRVLHISISSTLGFISMHNGYIPKRRYNVTAIKIDENGSSTQNSSYYDLALGYDIIESSGIIRVTEADYFDLTGDFNNDGLTDRIMFVPPSYIAESREDLLRNFYINRWPLNESPNFIIEKTEPKIYFFELGKDINSFGELQPIITTGIDFDKDSEAYAIEFNGDNIPEILLLNRTKRKFSIYKIEFGSLIPLLENQPLSNFNKDTPLIFGDFNGDGLTDFITPQKVYSIEDSNVNQMVMKINTEELKWWQYINTGIGFSKKERDFTNQKLAFCSPSQRNIIKKSSFWQKLWNGKPDEYQGTEYAACGVFPVDYNNDGRTDLIAFTKFGIIEYKETLADSKVIENITPITGQQFANKFRFLENQHNAIHTFHLNYNTQNEISVADDKISPLSLVINNSEYRGIEGQKAGIKFIDPIQRKEWRYDINNVGFLETQIQEVNNNSGVIQRIEYAPLSTVLRDGNQLTNGIYYKADSESLGLNYPYNVSKYQPNYLLVKRVSTLFDDTSISKEYRYESAVQNFEGKGFLGFQKIKVSDPYESNLYKGEYLPKNPFKGVMWKINTYDPEFENALVKTTYGSLHEEDLLTSTENTYERFDKPNHQYTFHTKASVSEDFLKGIIISKSYSYRASDLLLEQVVTNYNNEAVVTSSFEYQPPFYSGDHFFFGKIALNQVTIGKGSDDFTTKDEYIFNGNGSLKTHKKYGNNTLPLITDYTYFPNGNIRTEKISATGISPLTTSYNYEPTNRYVNKISAPDGQISLFEVNVLGQVLFETSPLGLTTHYEYDSWGNKNKITDYLGVETVLIKEKLTDGKYSLTTETPGVPKTIITFDRFDRQVQTQTQSINNKWIISDIVYDIFGKKIKESEPYFEGSSATQWNKYEYDALDRVIEQQLYTGKTITTCYEGMTVTVEDGTLKSSKTLDAMGNVIKHADKGGEILYDYYPNGTLKTANYDGSIISVEQDGWGNKTKLDDPSAGIYTYEYDVVGRLLTETTPKGQTEYTYDNYGKLLTETSTGDETDIVANYIYDPVTKLPTMITGSTGNGEHSFTYETFYDSYFRINGKKETHDAFVYQTNSEFDNYGRLKTITLTTTVSSINKTTTSKVENIYETNSGILIEQKDKLNNHSIWEINQVNEKGQVLQTTYGNGFVLENTFDELFLPTQIKHQNTTTNQTALEINYSFDPVKKRLNSRNLVVFGKNEQFQYDELDRLIKETVNNIVVNEYTYDKRGRMTYNTQVGYYDYDEAHYQIKKLGFNANGQDLKNNRGFHQLKFNAFKQVVEIHLPGHDRINYDFNLFKKRSIAYYGSEDENKNNRPVRKYYTSDNAVEIIIDNTTGQTKVTTYVDGDPYTAHYIYSVKYEGSSPFSEGLKEAFYLHRDYQGNLLALSDVQGRVVEQRDFDAWGNIREVRHIDWNGNTPTTLTNTLLGIIDRGYTGHEHLQSVGLIHMNGRLYDPVIRRFLSPDNFVQDPYNTQNFDRYGYVYNNPLMYADPSGEIFIVIAVTVGAAIIVNGINNLIHGVPFWYGMGKAATMAAVTAVVSFGVGTAVSSVSSTAGTAAVKETVKSSFKEIALSIGGQVAGSFLPDIDIPLGDFSISLNPVIMMGKGIGAGAAVGISYNSGEFTFSYGFGVTQYTKHYATGNSGTEIRNSFRVNYDNGRTGFSLGTNFWGGMKGIEGESLNQRTGLIGFRSGDFNIAYENDGSILGLGDGGDSYRTAALNMKIGDFTAGFNLFTGYRDYKNENGSISSHRDPLCVDDYGRRMPNGLVKEIGNPYRLGALTIGYKGIRVGVNSEHVRHAIQDQAIHNLNILGIFDKRQMGFENQSWDWKSYGQFITPNKFTSW